MKSARWVALAALAVLLAGCSVQQQGRYQMAPAANGRVWRLDTTTGEIRLYGGRPSGYFVMPEQRLELPAAPVE